MRHDEIRWIRWPAVALALLVATAMAWRAGGLAREPYPGLSVRGDRVALVYPGDPADRAGLQSGDRILAVNGVPVSEIRNLPAALRSGGTDRAVFLNIRRADFELAIELFPEPLPLRELLWQVAHAIVAGITLLIGTFALLRRSGRLTATFFGMCLALATLLFRPHVVASAWGYRLDAAGAEVLTALFPGLLMHFFLLFPFERPAIQRRPWLQILPYVPGALLLGATHLSARAASGPHDSREIALQTIAGVQFLGALVLAVILFAHAYRKSPLPTVRRKLKVTLGGTFLGIFPLALVLALREADPTLPLPGDRVATLAVFLLPASFGYAIVRHGIFDPELFVKGSLVYSGVTAALVLVYLGAYFALHALLSNATSGLEQRLGGGLGLLFIVLLLSPLRGKLQDRIDRWIYPDRYDTARALRETGLSLRAAESAEEAGRVLLQALRRLLGVEQAGLFRPLPNSGTFRLAAELKGEEIAVFPSDEYAAQVGRLLADTLFQLGRPASRGEFEAELPYGWLPRADLQVLHDLRAHVLLPLAAGERRLGLLIIGPRAFEEPYSPPDLELIEGLQTRAVLALENILYVQEQEERAGLERELALAASLQQQLLPGRLPALATYDLAAGTVPCREIGGDIYDCIPEGPSRMTLAIGDVSGKGVPAALLMANLQATFRAELVAGGGPREVITRVNRRLCALDSPARFVSFFCCQLDLERNRLAYTNAGHLQPILVRSDGQVERLDRGGLILGIMEDADYEDDEVALLPGDLVVFFTDGVTERGAPHELFGERDLIEVACRHRHLSAADLMGRILEVLEHRTGLTPEDDTTLMVLKAL